MSHCGCTLVCMLDMDAYERSWVVCVPAASVVGPGRGQCTAGQSEGM